MKLRLKYMGNGVFHAATPEDRREAMEKFHQGTVVIFEARKPRSRKQNDRLHALILKAWMTHPGERWVSPEHLRAWLFCKVGHKDRITIARDADLETIGNCIAAIVARVRAKDGYCFMDETPTTIEIDIPRSWKFTKCQHPEATRIMQEIDELICADVVPGITIKQLWEAVTKDAA